MARANSAESQLNALKSAQRVTAKPSNGVEDHSTGGTSRNSSTNTPPTALDIAAAIEKMSEWSGLPEEKIRSMSAAERADLSRRWLAATLDKPLEEVSTMPADEIFDQAINKLALKYGISYTDASRLADLQAKIDSGQSVSSDERKFLLEMIEKLRHKE